MQGFIIMSTEYFTQGPWRVMTHYGNELLVNEDTDKQYCVVLPKNGSWPEDTICEVWGENHLPEENANLIAASTDLYYALKECRDRLFEQFGNCTPVIKADAALNLALGIKEKDDD